MKDIVELRWPGRGGQGAKTASLLLADAAFNTCKYVQGFPEYGPERMGAPITAYNRISSERSTVHSNIYFPDYVVGVDETLLSAVDVTAGLKKEGAIDINSSKSPAERRPLLKGDEGRVCTIDAGKISEEELREKLKTALSGFGDDCTISKDGYVYTVNVWQEGLAQTAMLAQTGDKDAKEAWDKIAYTTMQASDSLQELLTASGYGDYMVQIQVLNDKNHDNTLLTVTMGMASYNCVS